MQNTLFYDGQCPICMKEMRLLNRYKNARLILQDIHHSGTPAIAKPYCNEQLLAVLHLKTARGSWLKGLDATVAAWGHTRFGFLLKPLRWPLIGSIADYFYYRWAERRVCNIQTNSTCSTLAK